MPEGDQSGSQTNAEQLFRPRFSRSLSAKLVALLIAGLVVCFGVLGFLNIRLHRRHLESNILRSAERVSDVVKRSTSHSMLNNDRESLYYTIRAMTSQPGIEKIRIFNKEGRISFSTATAEVNTIVDKKAEACYACHSQSQPIEHLNRPDRFRIFRGPDGNRVLGIISPIENQPSCSNAACHAHPADKKILGVLDTHLSLALTDQDIEESTMQMFGYTIFAVAAICVVSGLFVVRFVHRPLRKLESGTRRLAAGDLGHQIEVQSQDEIGELAVSFNTMSEELREAREENAAWTRELEKRVEQKTKEVQRAQEHVMQVEKMASVGKLAAVVAHEINNPLAGILTYTKLLKKWLNGAPLEESRREEVGSSLDLIETESRRCGEIVRNLLMFSRSAPMNLDWTDLNAVVERCAMLVRHQAELSAIELRLELEPELPRVFCDPAQIEQALLAPVMNAMDAMSAGAPAHGGTLWLRSRSLNDAVELDVEDDGPGIPPDVLPQIFEPFFTTKEKGHSVGLGLAVCRGIIERHGGKIRVKSEPARGTRFTISLPIEHAAPKPKPSPPIPATATKAR